MTNAASFVLRSIFKTRIVLNIETGSNVSFVEIIREDAFSSVNFAELNVFSIFVDASRCRSLVRAAP